MKIQLKLKYLTAALMFAGAVQTGFAMEDEQLRKSYNSMSQKEKNKISVEDYIKARKAEQVPNMHVDLKAEERVRANKFIDEALEKLRDAYKDPIFAEEFFKKKDLFSKTLKLEVAQNVEVQDSETVRKLQERIQELEQEKLKGGSGGLKEDYFDKLFQNAAENLEEVEAQRDAFELQLKNLGVEHNKAKQTLTDLGENPVKKADHLFALQEKENEHKLAIQKLDPAYKMKEQILNSSQDLFEGLEAARSKAELAAKPKVRNFVALEGAMAKAAVTIANYFDGDPLKQILEDANLVLDDTGNVGNDRKSNRGKLAQYLVDNGIAFNKDIDKKGIVAHLTPLVKEVADLAKINAQAEQDAKLEYTNDKAAIIKQFVAKLDKETLKFYIDTQKGDSNSDDKDTFAGIVEANLFGKKTKEIQGIIEQLTK